MITGEEGLKAKLFRPISVRGKMTYILSNNKANTNYFGRMQGDAIPVTMQDGHKIVEAAKALIGSKNCYFLPVTSQSLYTKCVIVWSDEVTKPEEDEMLRIWFGNESEAEKTDNIMRLAKARRGRVDILQECDKSKVVNVWQLSVPDKGCSASSFTQTTVGEVLANCIKHYEDMEIDRSEACKNADGTRRDYARPDSIILALSAMNKDNSIVPINNQMWMQLNNCVYNGGKYPSQLLSMIYERICKDALKAPAGTMYIIPPTLAGAIKAILIQQTGEYWEAHDGKSLTDAIHECRWAILKDAIQKRGHEAVADFVGTDISSDAYDHVMDETEAQMPDKEFERFWEKYI